ncbi:MAG: T9SS C-terminal target domain-containing protein, partial [Crocinitomicaceae bacterium]|nr:T9SS C-terminal target domain-containing protein [Crocinitomicaceae bacterium]
GVTAGVINYVDAKLDIDGDLRIRTVVKKDTLMRVLVIDTTDHNRVYYRDIALGTGGKGFYSCADTTGADTLISDSRINLNNYNLYFEKNDSLGVNHVGVGYNCGDNLRAKFSVQQIHPVMVNQSTIAISGVNRDTSNTINKTFTGVEGAAIGLQTLPKVVNRGGYFGAKNSQNTRGLVAEVPSSIANTSSAIGGEFIVSAIANDNRGVSVACTGNGGTGNSTNIGVFGNAANSGVSNVGGFFLGNSSNNTNGSAVGVSGSAAGSSVTNVGGTFSVVPNYNAVNIATSGRIFSPVNAYTYPSNVAIGVYGYSNTNPTNEYAGFFDGDVWINGPATATGFAVTTSDQNFKSDINPIHNADSILMEVKPKTFYFDTLNPYGFNFSNRKQYGLLAQQVETILPELVSNEYKPATVDSIGTIIKPGVNYKALNYDAFISILIKGHQEQSKKIDSLQLTVNNRDSIINDLNDRLTHLESCLSGILPFLCQISHNSIQPTQQEFQQQLKKEIDVQLSNRGTIILNQNVPNPFAEQTQISFSIPETVKKAQIHFYDANGKLINSVEVQERGLGQLNVFANDLSTGMYTYTLVADGQIVATKKMMKQ